jgi:hypothetical protein
LRARAAATLLILLPVFTSAALSAQSSDAQDQDDGTISRQVMLRLFGSIEWGATDDPREPNSFALGQLDLFVTAALTERTSLLAEFVLEESTETRVITDLERLQLTFRFNDYLQVSAGRYHTGIGYYNTAFHHGAIFETAIGRPRIFLFEDDGGILPIHDVGVVARGEMPGTGSNLHYLVELGNGRLGASPDPDREARDENDAKSFNVGLAYRPQRWRGLELGASYRRDRVPRPLLSSVDEDIAATYAVYRTSSTEILAEWISLAHRAGEGPRYHDPSGYVQLSRAWGAVRPYYRYDRVTVDPATPLIGDSGSYEAHIAGFRVDPLPSIGFKAQYERVDAPVTGRGHVVRTQLAFVF